MTVLDRFAPVVAAAAILASAMPAHAADFDQQIDFSIPSQSLSAALLQFAEQSRIQVLTSSAELDGYESPGAQGRLSVQAALKAILAGTGLSFRKVGEGTVTIARPGETPSAATTSGGANANDSGHLLLAQVEQGQGTDPTTRASARRGDEDFDQLSSKRADLTVEEVIVTAQKREQRLQDVPMSITAFSGAALTSGGIDNALDLSFAVPGLAVTETGPGRQVIVIRGISSIRGSSSLTGVYLDEMPVTGAQDGFVAAYPDLRTIDLERVEVLRGPQGTLFGEGAAGGVIRFITKDPDLRTLDGEISTELYNTADGGWSEEVTAIANLPLSDVFGVRVAAKYENKSGWIDQPSIGRENINDSDVKHVRVKALYSPTPELRVKGLAEIHRNQGGGSNIVNQEPRRDSNFLQAFDRSAPTDYVDDYDLFNLAVTYDFGFAELLSSTSYAKLNSRQSFAQIIGDEPTPWLEILIRELPQDASIASQEFRFTSAAKGPFNWSVGTNYKDVDLSAGFGDAGADVRLLGGAASVAGLLAGTEPTTKSESWAGFANASYEFIDRFEIGGGLRYFYDKREAFDPTVPGVAPQSADFDQLTFRTYVKYRVSDNANLYFNVANGFRSGGFNRLADIRRGAPNSYQQEETLFYEVGAKTSLFDGRLRFDGALFYGEFKGMQEDVAITSDVDGLPLQFTTNSQDTELKGIEWDISWLAADRLTLKFSGDVTDSEVIWIDPRSTSSAYYVGDPINFVPEYSLSVGGDFRFQWSDAVPGFVVLNYDRKGKAHYSDRANPLLLTTENTTPELNFLNASIVAEWNGWKWSLVGRNLLDEYRAVNPAPTGWTAQLRRRTVGVGISKRF